MIPLALFFTLAMSSSDTLTRASLEQLLPPTIRQWDRAGPSRLYTGREIFHYIDGAGEVYLAYKFNAVLVQRYARPGQEEILVEIFDMATSHNAFGVCTYTRGRGPAVPVGQDGEYRSGLLCFWRDRFCVYVRIDQENDEAKGAVLELGKRIADAIRVDGERPGILRYLPDGAFEPGSLRYFYRHEILNTHFYVADENPFLLDDRTEAVLARTTLNASHVLLIAYLSDGQADTACVNALKHLLPDAKEPGVVKTENGKWTACERSGTFVVTVFDAATKQNALEVLNSVRARLP